MHNQRILHSAPRHPQNAPIKRLMAQGHAGAAHPVSLTVCCQDPAAAGHSRLALSEHAPICIKPGFTFPFKYQAIL